jgi:hypothetical protein
MWGYFDRVQGAQGILDSLYARVLVLDDGARRVAYVDLDLGRSFGSASLDRLRDSVKSAGITHLIVQATHTHAGPVVMDVYPSGPPAWETAALDKIAQAIRQALEHSIPVRLGVGYGVASIAYNRLRVGRNGQVAMLWSNPARIPTWPVDSTVAVLRIDRTDGQPLAILVNYAAHPVTFGSDMLQFSADFPGVMCKVVQQSFAGKPLVFYMQGAAGDINVYDAGTPITQDAVGRRDWAGETLGKAVVDVARSIKTEPDPDPRIDVAQDTLLFRLRWDPARFRNETLREMGPDAFKYFAPPVQEKLALPVVTLLIDRKIALMTMPGEPFVEFQMSWRSRCPVHDCLFLGYTNGYFGYLPTIQAGVIGGYGAASASTWVELGAGEQIMNHAIIRANSMLGLLKDSPSSDWQSLP